MSNISDENTKKQKKEYKVNKKVKNNDILYNTTPLEENKGTVEDASFPNIRKRGRKKKNVSTSMIIVHPTEDEKVRFNAEDSHEMDNIEHIEISFGSINISVENKQTEDLEAIQNDYMNNFRKNEVDKFPNVLIQNGTDNTIHEEKEKNMLNFFKVNPQSGFSLKTQDPVPINVSNSIKGKNIVKKIVNFHNVLKEFKRGNIEQWPQKTNVWCYWCCHPFTNEPVPCPINYDKILDIYEVEGIFCSWACSAAFSMDKYNSLTYIYKFINKCIYNEKKQNDSNISYEYIDINDIKIAPNKICLSDFGGYMTIEDFRNQNKINLNIKISTSDILYINQDILETYNEITKKNY